MSGHYTLWTACFYTMFVVHKFSVSETIVGGGQTSYGEKSSYCHVDVICVKLKYIGAPTDLEKWEII